MNVAKIVLLSLILVVLLAQAILPQRSYDYKVIFIEDSAPQQIDRLGDGGWDIASVRRATTGVGTKATAGYEFIMKRTR